MPCPGRHRLSESLQGIEGTLAWFVKAPQLRIYFERSPGGGARMNWSASALRRAAPPTCPKNAKPSKWSGFMCPRVFVHPSGLANCPPPDAVSISRGPKYLRLFHVWNRGVWRLSWRHADSVVTRVRVAPPQVPRIYGSEQSEIVHITIQSISVMTSSWRSCLREASLWP